MNQIFNISRFVKYAFYRYSVQGKKLLLLIAGAALALLAIQVIVIKNSDGPSTGMDEFFLTFLFGGAALFIGQSFVDFRRNETSLNFLMIPASSFEKFLFEYLSRLVFFILVYPVLFYFLSFAGNFIVSVIWPEKILYNFSLGFLTDKAFEDELLAVFWVYFIGGTIIFAGTTVFKKFPLVKTTLFVGLFWLVIVMYFYLTMVKLNLKDGALYTIKSLIPDEETALAWLNGFLSLTLIMLLFYSFFKLNEKEVK
jgi:hypothetical protein